MPFNKADGQIMAGVLNENDIDLVDNVDDADEKTFVSDNGIHMMPENVFEKYKNMKDWEPCCGQSYGVKLPYTLRKNGRWMPQGEGMWGTSSVHIGHAENYRDPSF